MALDSVEMGRKLREIREENHMTQKMFASVLNISQQTLSRYENGKTIIPYEDLRKVVTVFGVSVEYILELENSEMTSDEIRLVDYYRRLDDGMKQSVKNLLKAMAEEFPDKSKSYS